MSEKISPAKKLADEVEALEEAATLEVLEKKKKKLERARNGILLNGKKAEMRKPKVRDLRLAEEAKTPAEKELILMRNLTGLTEDELDDLEVEDYEIYQGMLQGFLS